MDKPRRIRDPQAVNAARLDHCEHCGVKPDGLHEIHVHHIKSRGAGGDDVPGNLIALCWRCHDAVHRGAIPRAALEAIAAARGE